MCNTETTGMCKRRLYRLKEAAVLLGLKPSEVRRAMERGKLHGIKIPGTLPESRWWFSKDDLDRHRERLGNVSEQGCGKISNNEEIRMNMTNEKGSALDQFRSKNASEKPETPIVEEALPPDDSIDAQLDALLDAAAKEGMMEAPSVKQQHRIGMPVVKVEQPPAAQKGSSMLDRIRKLHGRIL